MVRELKAIDKVIIALNMIVYRVDALLNNFVEGVFILSYCIVVTLLTGYEIKHLSDTWSYLAFLPTLLHVLYMIVYVINDAIDYRTKAITKPSIDESFYYLRPIYYFKGSKALMVYFTILYMLVIVLMSIRFQFNKTVLLSLVTFIGTIILLSVLHSTKDVVLRVMTFCLLRVTKYTYLLILFCAVEFGQLFSDIIIFSISSLVIPYTMYVTLSYAKYFSSKYKIFKIPILAISISISLILLSIIAISYPLVEIAQITILGYACVVLPALTIRQGLRKFLGVYNPSYYHHLLRLALGAILTFFVLLTSITILIDLHTNYPFINVIAKS